MFKYFKKGFSLAELMIVLLLVSLLITALIPVITKKHLSLPKGSEHGSYLCYYNTDDGKLHEKKMSSRNAGLIEDREVAQCIFNPPPKALYFQISAVGGGGGGGDSGYNGGNTYATWSQDIPISPFNMTEEDMKNLHVIYKNAAYMPNSSDINVETDLSAELQVFARSNDSYNGGDMQTAMCRTIIPKTIWENRPDVEVDFEMECPKVCPSNWEELGCTKKSDSMCRWGAPSNVHYSLAAGSSTSEPKEVCTHYSYEKDCTPEPGHPSCCEGSFRTEKYCPGDYKRAPSKVYYCCEGVKKWNYSSSPKSPDACEGAKICSETTYEITDECTVDMREREICDKPVIDHKVCDEVTTVYVPSVTSEPTEASGTFSWDGSGVGCCECPEGVEMSSSTECENIRAIILDRIHTLHEEFWSNPTACYPSDGFYPKYKVHIWRGGSKGFGVGCVEDVGEVYKLSYDPNNFIETDRKGYDGSDSKVYGDLSRDTLLDISKLAGFINRNEDNESSGNGKTLCQNEEFMRDCRLYKYDAATDSYVKNESMDMMNDWSNVKFSSASIIYDKDSTNEKRYTAKAYNAPRSGGGLKVIEKDLNTSINTRTKNSDIHDSDSLSINYNCLVKSENIYSLNFSTDEATCAISSNTGHLIQQSDICGYNAETNPNPFSNLELCSETTAKESVEKRYTNNEGVSGKCGLGNEVSSSHKFCGKHSISDNDLKKINAAYCLIHANGYDIYSPSESVSIPRYELGYQAKKGVRSEKVPTYHYRSMKDNNYLTYGNAGYPGEIKTIVVRSLKDVNTTINIGRGGAGAVKGSGADGMPGSATSMGDVITVSGGKGGKGSIIGASEELTGYDEDYYTNENEEYNVCISDPANTFADCAKDKRYFKSTGKMQSSVASLTSLATNLFNFVKSLKQDKFTEQFDAMGKGGEGGGVTHRCWAGQFVVWFEGQYLDKTSVFRNNGSNKYKRIEDTTNYTGDIPDDAADTVPASGACYKKNTNEYDADYVLEEAGSGVDGAILIRW